MAIPEHGDGMFLTERRDDKGKSMNNSVCITGVAFFAFAAMTVSAADTYYVNREIDLLGNTNKVSTCADDKEHRPCRIQVGGLPAQSELQISYTQLCGW